MPPRAATAAVSLSALPAAIVLPPTLVRTLHLCIEHLIRVPIILHLIRVLIILHLIRVPIILHLTQVLIILHPILVHILLLSHAATAEALLHVERLRLLAALRTVVRILVRILVPIILRPTQVPTIHLLT